MRIIPQISSDKENPTKANWVLPLVLAIAFFMENMDSNIISTSLPQIAMDIKSNPIALKLAMTSYLVSLSIFIPISGYLADNFTSKRIFCYAIFVFMLGSILCSGAKSLSFFVIARFLQGMGGAMMVPVGRLVILRTTPKDELVATLSFFAMPALIGPLIGPPLGGVITTYFSWHWIFLINIPIGVIGLICSYFFMPNNEKIQKSKLDLIGFLLTAIATASLIFGTSIITLENVPKYYGFCLCLLGLIFFYLYFKYAKNCTNPLFNMQIFENKLFRQALIGGNIFRLGIGAIPFLLPLLLQLGFHMTPMQSGGLTFIVALGSIAMKLVVDYIFNRFGFYYLLIIGTIISSLLTASYGFFTLNTPYWVILLLLFLGGFLRSMFFSAINALNFSEIKHEDMAQATPIHAVSVQTSLALGIALGGIILESCMMLHNGELKVVDFQYAFIIISLISMSSIFIFTKMDKNIGHSLYRKKL